MKQRSDKPAAGVRLRRTPIPWASPNKPQTEAQLSESDELFVETFARGLAVIRSFANRHQPLTIAEVSRRAGVSRSAARRLLHTLVTLGYATVNEHGFTLLPKTLTLGAAFLSSDALVELGQPIVNRLAAATGGSFFSLNVLQSHEVQMVCLAYLVQPSELKMADPSVGMSAPLYCSSSGLLFLSAFTASQFDHYLATVPLRPYTQRTMTDPQQLAQRLKQIQQQGFAMIDREMSNDLRSVSVPVRDREERIIAALVSMVTTQQAGLAELQGRVPMLKAAAHELGRQL